VVTVFGRLLTACALVVGLLTPAAPPARPNILLVNTDDQRAGTMSAFPKIARWAAGARTYPRFQTGIPSCCPSRAAMFSGRYPHNNGVLRQADAARLDMATTVQASLRGAGYHTAMAGKFLVSWRLRDAPPSFERYTTIGRGYRDYDANVDGRIRRVQQYSTTFLGERLRTYLRGFEADDARPWFAYYAPQAPHPDGDGLRSTAVPDTAYAGAPVPRCVRPNEADRSDKPPYVRTVAYREAEYQAVCASQLRALRSVDDQVDALLRQLAADGELANTLVILTSDNGYQWGEHGWTAKFLPYLPSVRVPLLMRWDGHLAAGTDNRLATVVDLAPTMLAAAGVPVPRRDGRSLLGPPGHGDLYSEYFRDPANGNGIPTWAALYDGGRHYVETYGPDGARTFREYYDLRSDPGENLNLLGDASTANDPPPAVLAAVAAKLARARAAAGPALP
jgi:N-acetylglucosamine-6-sulfatase